MDIPIAYNVPWTRKHDKPGSPLLRKVTVAYPETLEQLIEFCRNRKPGTHYHAAGSHWALSSAAFSDQVFIETNDPNEVFPAMGRTLYDVVPGCLSQAFLSEFNDAFPSQSRNARFAAQPPIYFYHVEAGKRIYQLYSEMDQGDENEPASLCARMQSQFKNSSFTGAWGCATLGGAGGQTVIGALTTGTHGGDFDRGPIADSVMALHIVADGGKQHWIERRLEIPFTDDKALHARYGENLEIHRDNRVFNAALVQVGRFGIVYSVVLRVVKQYALREECLHDTWEKVKSKIANFESTLYIQPFKTNDEVPIPQQFLQIVVCPAPTVDGTEHTCAITRRWTLPLSSLTDGDPEGRSERVGRIITPYDWRLNAPRFENAGNNIAYSPDGDHRMSTFDRACADANFVIGAIKAVIHEIEDFVANHAVEIGGGLGAATAVGVADTLSALIPALLAILALLAALLAAWSALTGTTRLGQVLDDTRGALLDNPDPIARAAGILVWRAIAAKVFGMEQKEQTFQAISYAVMDLHNYTDRSCQVNVQSVEVFFDAADPNLIAFVDQLLRFENNQEWENGAAVVGYISLRFTGETSALLGMQPFRRTCAVECSGLADVKGSTEFVAYAVRLALDPNIKGILHWGQRNDSAQADVEFRFDPGPEGKLGEWRAVLATLTDNGRLDGFTSDFTRRTGLEVVQPRIGSFILVGPAAPWTLNWNCTANPPDTTVALDIVSPGGATQHVGNLPLTGTHTVHTAKSGTHHLRLTASLTRNGVIRHSTQVLDATAHT